MQTIIIELVGKHMAKLYATTISSKTSKGVGDNEKLEIELNFGNERIGTLCYTIHNDRPYLDIELANDKNVYEISLNR